VGPPEIDEALRRNAIIGLDSCILIYAIEANPLFGRASQRIIEQVEAGCCVAVISTLAAMEVLVGPFRRGNEKTAEDVFASLLNLANARWVQLNFPIADRAARLKAEYRLSTPDAVHLATAMESGATLFVTNDRDIPPIPGIDLLTL